MANRIALIHCSHELCVKIKGVAKDYHVQSSDYADLSDFISAIESDDVTDNVVIIQLTDENYPLFQANVEKLGGRQNLFSMILIHDESKLSLPDSIEDIIDFELNFEDDISKIRKTLARATRSAMVKRKLEHAKSKSKDHHTVEAFIGKSVLAREVRTMIQKLINNPISSIFISGETGTGKGLVARILHAQDEHQHGPLVEVNCSAIPKELLESELFGHESGAFTGAKKMHRGYLELADEGTLFLDEITEMDVELQAKLLKALEDKTIRRVGGERDINIDISIIAATNRNPLEAIDQQFLREDLYHRISVFSLYLPSLKSRKEDLLDLVPTIVSEFNIKAGKNVNIIEDSTWDKFMQYDWPGNIRELRNVIERCVLFSDNEVFSDKWMAINNDSDTKLVSNKDSESELMLTDLEMGPEDQKPGKIQNVKDNSLCTFPLDGTISLEEMEKEIIQRGLELQNGNVTETARLLSISREKLRYRIKKHSLEY